MTDTDDTIFTSSMIEISEDKLSIVQRAASDNDVDIGQVLLHGLLPTGVDGFFMLGPSSSDAGGTPDGWYIAIPNHRIKAVAVTVEED